MMRRLPSLLVVVALLALAAAAPATASPARVDVVVEFEAPSLATAVRSSRALTTAAKARRLNLSAPTSAAHLRTLASAQRSLEARLARELPAADVGWRYGVVLNGLAVSLPAGDVARLAGLPGVARVYPSVRYRARLDDTPALIGAPAVWGPDLSFGGSGMKIAVLDDGVDHTHPFFDPRSFSMPPGYPLGQAAHTSAKVIVARAFPPRHPAWRNAGLPHDPVHSAHATHVAGIAAGNNGVSALGRRVSGIAPRAHIGNYKVLTIPTESGVGLNGNAPEIAAGIEQAVRDGMDVINLSLGEPEIEPARDLVVRAVEGAVAAGVVVAIAAGNDFHRFGAGSIGSPGSAPSAITVGATSGRSGPAAFSSAAPTPISLLLKPELSAPGVGVVSSLPMRVGGWGELSGTSMAAPHVAGAAALLRQRRPDWTPAQVKAALVLTADPVGSPFPARAGAGIVNVSAAVSPLVVAEPAVVSFGLLPRAAGPAPTRNVATATVQLSDAGGGAGGWTVAVEPAAEDRAVRVTSPSGVAVPGALTVTATLAGTAAATEHSGWIVLRREGAVRRIPYWLGTTQRRLSAHRTTPLRRTGTYAGNTARGRALVSAYRYPANPSGAGVVTRLNGPEQVFRVRLAAPTENFGVAVLAQRRGVRIEPRIVAAGDESRLVGYTALPLNLNPYLADFGRPRPISGAIRPAGGAYDVVFDTPHRSAAGPFRFRFWINDTVPPRLRLLTRAVVRNQPVRVAAFDAGSGVDPRSVRAHIGTRRRPTRTRDGSVLVDTRGLGPGSYRLVLRVSDRQETRNMENVGAILPNTATLRATVRIR
jgi:subtilisin family serine protease